MKRLTHFERIHTDCRPVLQMSPRPTVRSKRVSSVDPITNRVITKIEKVTIDRPEEMKIYQCSDFAMENLLAVGATLNPTSMTASPYKAVSDMQSVLSNLETPTE